MNMNLLWGLAVDAGQDPVVCQSHCLLCTRYKQICKEHKAISCANTLGSIGGTGMWPLWGHGDRHPYKWPWGT